MARRQTETTYLRAVLVWLQGYCDRIENPSFVSGGVLEYRLNAFAPRKCHSVSGIREDEADGGRPSGRMRQQAAAAHPVVATISQLSWRRQ